MRPDPAYAGYRAGSFAARRLPDAAVLPVSRVIGRVGARAMSGRRTMVERHQRRVRPALSEPALSRVVDAVFASYAQYWLESFRLPGTPESTLEAGFRHVGFEHVQRGLDQGRGVILALPHLGGWEWAAFWLTACQGVGVTAVVEPVEPPRLARWFADLREDLGMEIVPLGPEAGSACTRALKANRVLALLSDRDIGGNGVEVELFGERTTIPGGPATLAVRTGAALLPAAVYFEGDHHLGVARPPLDTSRRGRLREDVARISQDLATELEALIARAPEQWHLLQPNWPSDRAAVAQ